jgi:protocatechuate 3,4-dioxygenase beta subunit
MNRRQFAIGLIAVPRLIASPGVRLVGKDEPGEPLVVSGTIYQPDGRTPAPGVGLFGYHTDADGYYSRPQSDPRRARIRGRLTTDERGWYGIRTILPGHYPGRGNPRHIHVHVAAPGYPEHWIDSFLFAGDPYLTEPSPAAFSHIMRMRREGGTWRGMRDIRLDRDVAERNRLVGGWYRQ